MNPFQERKEFLSRLKSLKPSKKQTIPRDIPDDLFIKCPNCDKSLTQRAVVQNLRVCPECQHHFPLTAYHRLKTLLDSGTFKELFSFMKAVNPLSFPGYDDKLQGLRKSTGIREAVISAVGKIDGNRVVIAVMDSRFLMGSMGSVVGEKIALTTEYATKHKLPLVIFCASGGARMQEGIVSLFQMAKTAAAIKAHSQAGLLYISVLTNPTTGGVTASFASLGDIILAEPKALIGFAGPRVIEQTIRQKLPDGFQRSEHLLSHGFIDAIVSRLDMKQSLSQLLAIHKRRL